MLQILELFGGIGAPRKALENIGIDLKSIDYVEILPYAVEAYNAIFDNNYKPQDIRIWNLNVDLLIHGSPCFTKDTLILTKEGYKNIINIKIGDYVLDHTNKYNLVTNFIEQGEKEIWNINAMCFDELNTTNNHKFYVRKKIKKYNEKDKKYYRTFNEPEWIECNKLSKDYYIGVAINTEEKIPIWNGIEYIRGKNKYIKKNLDLTNEIFWYICGRFLGDGWVTRRKDRNNNISGAIICCGKHEVKEFENKIGNLFSYTKVEDRTTFKYQISNKEFGEFLNLFGKGAKNKFIPGFVIDLPIKQLHSFLEGYFDSDGCHKNGLYKATSISKNLIYGIGQCVAKVYKRPFAIYKDVRKKTCLIENRIVNQNDTYQIVFRINNSKQDKAFYENGYIWCPIKSITNTNKYEITYDITVENTHSFTANSCIVHNCQDFSKNGLNNINTGRSILYERTLEIIEYELLRKPRYILWENVPNLLSERHISHFNHYLNKLESLGYINSFMILNSKFYNAPQNRERIYVISSYQDKEFIFPEPTGSINISSFIDYNTNFNDYQLSENEKSILFYENDLLYVREATKLGYKLVEEYDTINLERPNSKTRRGRVGKQIAQTITTHPRQAIYYNNNLRMLTAKEHLRIMGYTDVDYFNMINIGLKEKQISALAGNSISVKVLEAIFNKLLKES